MIIADTKLTDRRLSEKTGPLLFCAITAVVLHNLIDFAFFEPGVSTIFWALTACMAAWHLNKNKQHAAIFMLDKTFRITGVCLGILFTWVFLHFAVVPPVRASYLQEQAMQDAYTMFSRLNAAEKADPLSSEAYEMHGNILIRQFQMVKDKKPEILYQAIDCFTEAKKRDHANYSYYEKLSIIHDLLASIETGEAAKASREKAAYWIEQAIIKYPNSARLHIEAAEIAESNMNIEKALRHYQKAIEIEDAYREIFKVMYPDRDVFSRLGEDKYQLAKQKVKQFSSQRPINQ